VRVAFLGALITVALGCAHARREEAALAELVPAGSSIFRLEYGPDDVGAATRVKLALRRSASAAEQWGRFSTPVVITIHPTHEALEAASHREGNGWMLAWSRYASVDLQSPRTWSATDSELAQLLTHELTHCAMYQSMASPALWQHRAMPLWFREGMASVTAGQGHRRVAPDAIKRFYWSKETGAGAQAGDPLTDPEPLYASKVDLVYATADKAFRFLLDRHGEARVRLIMASMAKGDDFREAFRNAIGIPVQEFEADFRRSLVTEGQVEDIMPGALPTTPPPLLAPALAQGTASLRP